MKTCSKCGQSKPLDGFHRQRSGPLGRHSWCRPCANATHRYRRKTHGRPPGKKKWQLHTRYRLTPEDVERMHVAQRGLCAICERPMARACIDHDHSTKRVRDLLCHRCNLWLAAVENDDFRNRALRYLERHGSAAT